MAESAAQAKSSAVAPSLPAAVAPPTSGPEAFITRQDLTAALQEVRETSISVSLDQYLLVKNLSSTFH